MSKQYCISCLVVLLYLSLLNGANIRIRPLIVTTTTYKPSTLLLPPGFDSQKAPRQPMQYPYTVSASGISARPKLRNVPTTTPGWIPVAPNVNSDLPLRPNLQSTTPTLKFHSVPVMKDRISSVVPKHSSPSYKDGAVFESIVYGTWKPDPPLQPVEILNGTKQQQHGGSNSNVSEGLVVDGQVYNKTINRQHGGFIGHILQKPTKADIQIVTSTTLSPVEYKSKEFTKMSSEQKLQSKVKKQGRRKILPIRSTTDQNPIERSLYTEAATATIPTNIQEQQNVIKVKLADAKLMEVVNQINESTEIKYNHKQTSTHSIDMMTTADVHDDDDYADSAKLDNVETQFFSTEPQINYDDYNFAAFENVSATRKSWPTDFMEEPSSTSEGNFQSMNSSEEFTFQDSLEADPSKIPLALSAFNIPPSLWPNLPGNITKLGQPYEAKGSAEEPALCVPMTVREQNIMNLKDLVYIERVFCFPMPPFSTTNKNIDSPLEKITTLRSVTTPKVQNFHDFIDSNSRVSNASSIFKNHFHLVTSILIFYFNFFCLRR